MQWLPVTIWAALLMSMGLPMYADKADDYLRAEMATRHIPGLSVAVVQDGQVLRVQGYGLADVEAKGAATPATAYQLASLTKQFTAAAVLKLARDGKLTVDDLLAKYIPDAPDSWRCLTVRHLLNQTSGLPNYFEGLNDKALGYTYTDAEVVKLAAAKPLLFPPGTRFSYCNINYHLLGIIIEKASGKSYGEYLRETFFAPLGMTQTRLYNPASVVPNRAQGYLWDGHRRRRSRLRISPTIQFGDSGLVSTVGDLMKWDAALNGGALLTLESKTLLWTPPVIPGDETTEYASGWIVTEVNGHRLIWHNGALPTGFTNAFFKFPDDKLTLIVLSNLLDVPRLRSTKPLYALMLGLAKLYLPALAQEAPAADPDPKITQSVRRVLTALAQGKADSTDLTPEMYAALTPDVIARTNRNLTPLGKFQPQWLTLVDRKEDNGLQIYRYHALYGETTILWMVSLTSEGKVSGLVPLGEE